MSKGIVTKITGTVSLFLLSFSHAYPQDTIANPVRMMFYNVENLFDTSDDPVTDDDEFLPYGLRRWNYQRYDAKIHSLYKTIMAAGEWDPPAIVALCEIENREVLADLVYGTNLVKFKYEILHEDSPDPRGIDVCLIYRKDKVKILTYSYLKLSDSTRTNFRTRSILYAKCLTMDDTIHLFANHWPSRRGGVLAGESTRQKISEMLKSKVDSIANDDGRQAAIIITGDFNAVPGDEIIASLGGSYLSGLKMVNLSDHFAEGTGTYRYLGVWEMIDQVIVSDVLSVAVSLRIFNPPFLLQDDPNYPGQSPFSTYRGYRYQGGYSDHLPLVLDINVKQPF